MVIPLAIMYIIGLNGLAIFLRTRRMLGDFGEDEITKRGKYLHGLNMMGFFTCIISVVYLILLEVMAFVLVRFDEFLIDFFSVPISTYFPPVVTIMLAFVAGYNWDPRESFVPINRVGDRWLSFIILLILLTGIIGVLTGILI